MQRVLRHLRDLRPGRRLAPDPVHHLVHGSGVMLSCGDGEPLRFASAGAAETFARRFVCEPLAYAARPASVTAPAAA